MLAFVSLRSLNSNSMERIWLFHLNVFLTWNLLSRGLSAFHHQARNHTWLSLKRCGFFLRLFSDVNISRSSYRMKMLKVCKVFKNFWSFRKFWKITKIYVFFRLFSVINISGSAYRMKMLKVCKVFKNFWSFRKFWKKGLLAPRTPPNPQMKFLKKWKFSIFSKIWIVGLGGVLGSKSAFS